MASSIHSPSSDCFDSGRGIGIAGKKVRSLRTADRARFVFQQLSAAGPEFGQRGARKARYGVAFAAALAVPLDERPAFALRTEMDAAFGTRQSGQFKLKQFARAEMRGHPGGGVPHWNRWGTRRGRICVIARAHA
jgi:hypothetical protein